MTPVRAGLAGAAVALSAQGLLVLLPPGGARRWERRNHRGAPVSLVAGPALALAVATGSPAAATAALGAGALGLYDDVAGGHDKGFRGHLRALREGRVTSGLVKVVGLGAVGLVASARLGRRPLVDVLLDGAVVAGAANAVNLFDLRPGRALKVGLAAGVLTGQTGPAAACAVLLPSDLGERTMLGDAGANALGAALGLGVVARTASRGSRLRWLLALAGTAAASEAVSFSAVIDAVPPLRLLDRLGRVA